MTPTQKPDSDVVINSLIAKVGEKTLLNDISLEIRRGQHLAIMGANGSGKTTLIRHLNGLIKPSSGSVLIGGYATDDKLRLHHFRKLVGIVFQNPDDQMVAVTVEREIAFGLENLACDRSTMVNRVDETLERFNLAHLSNRATTALSGGEQQRVAIAAVWATAPDIMVLDEPTSMLDTDGAESVMAALSEIEGRQTIVHVTQSLDEACSADRLIVLEKGQIVLDGLPDDLLKNSDLLVALGVANRSRPTNLDITGTHEPILIANDLHHTITDGPTTTEVLKGFSFQINRGEVLALTGPSGSGKTTCAYHANRLLIPDSGELTLDGVSYDQLPLHHIRRNVGLTFQRVDLQLFGETVWQDIKFGLDQQNIDAQESLKRAKKWLERLGLPFDEYKDRRPATLSMGEKRRVALAAILVLEPQVVVMDEPNAGLDARGTDALIDIIGDLQHTCVGIMVITHDHQFAKKVATHFAHFV